MSKTCRVENSYKINKYIILFYYYVILRIPLILTFIGTYKHISIDWNTYNKDMCVKTATVTLMRRSLSLSLFLQFVRWVLRKKMLVNKHIIIICTWKYISIFQIESQELKWLISLKKIKWIRRGFWYQHGTFTYLYYVLFLRIRTCEHVCVFLCEFWEAGKWNGGTTEIILCGMWQCFRDQISMHKSWWNGNSM